MGQLIHLNIRPPNANEIRRNAGLNHQNVNIACVAFSSFEQLFYAITLEFQVVKEWESGRVGLLSFFGVVVA